MTQLTKTYFIALCLLVLLLCINCSKDSNQQNNDLPNADQYITWSINGDKGSLTSPADSLASARYASDTHLAGSSTSTQDGITIIFRGNRATGTYTATYSDFYIKQKSYSVSSNTLQVMVTKYGNVGDYIEGSYSGKFSDPASANSLPINGNFRLKTR